MKTNNTIHPSIQLAIRRNPISRSHLRRGFLLTPLFFAVAWLALSPLARAQCNDGCDTIHGNTYQGTFALGSNTTGSGNTAFGSTTLNFNTTGVDNTAVGFDALQVVVTGTDNTAIGFGALFKNTASGNTACGGSALEFNTTGVLNTATGQGALNANTTGSENTANGQNALLSNTTGGDNTATGWEALFHNTTASNNTADGYQALTSNTTGTANTATGHQALFANTTANNNTANGYNALNANTTGANNTATGYAALLHNTTGADNTANGLSALAANTIGTNNTANGVDALDANTSGADNTAEGRNALLHNTTGGSNIALGYNAGQNLTTGSNNIDIGNSGVAAEAGKIRIGTTGTQTATYIAGISGQTVAGGVAVIIDTTGHLGTVVSSERFKDTIKPMDKLSEAILALQPVTFRYKKELDPQAIPQFGLVAEQVEKVDPDLVARDQQGKPYSVRYEAVNAMLLNEFLKEHRRVEEQAATLKTQESRIGVLQATVAQQRKDSIEQQQQIKALSTTLQEVSNQLELIKPESRLVADKE